MTTLKSPLIKTKSYLTDRLKSFLSDNSWQYLPGVEAIKIDEIVSPLRYDILIRLEFLRLIHKERDTIGSNFEVFFNKTLGTNYYTWYVETLRFYRSEALNSEDKLRTSYRKRVLSTLKLYRSFCDKGFDPREPITLATGKNVLPTDTGKRLPLDIYAHDGCHRIALLMFSGATTLQPGQYRLKRFQECRPLDRTNKLLPHLHLSEMEYCEFISMAYSEKAHTTFDELSASVKQHSPARVGELENIIRIDKEFICKAPKMGSLV